MSVSSYRSAHFSRAVLFCQPHQQLFTHSRRASRKAESSNTLRFQTRVWGRGAGCGVMLNPSYPVSLRDEGVGGWVGEMLNPPYPVSFRDERRGVGGGGGGEGC